VEISRDVHSQEGAVEEDKQSAASHNVSLFFGIRYVGVFITAYLSGFLLEYIDKRDSMSIIFVFSLHLNVLIFISFSHYCIVSSDSFHLKFFS
jgi:hypothetical protein